MLGDVHTGADRLGDGNVVTCFPLLQQLSGQPQLELLDLEQIGIAEVQVDRSTTLLGFLHAVTCASRCRLHIVVRDNGTDSARRGLPSVLPLARAFAKPERTRSWISDRSNSAIAPMTWNISRPEGVVRSIVSRSETN